MIYKRRGIEERLLSFAGHFKVVLLTGARQVGKSTLLAHLFPGTRRFVFDPLQDLYGARRDPDLFLDQFPPPLILDEIQYAPELLPAIKRRVDESGKPGDYLLSGSQQLSMLHDVSESLAGRVGILTLGPMTWSELGGWNRKKPWVADYLDSPGDIASGNVSETGGLYRTVWRGTMPGILEMPDDLVADYQRAYVETYIERDIRRQGDIRDSADFIRFASVLNALSGQEINVSKIARDSGIVPQTARKWAAMLAACYQWYEIMPWSGSSVKRLTSRSKGFSRDSGLCCWFQRISSPAALASYPGLGALFETFIVGDMTNQISLMPSPPQLWHWRTAGGAEVDLVLERDGFLYPIEIKCKSRLGGHDLSGIAAFMKTYPDRAKPGVVIYAGRESYKVAENIAAVPWSSI